MEDSQFLFSSELFTRALRWRLGMPQASQVVSCSQCKGSQGTRCNFLMHPADMGLHAQTCETSKAHEAVNTLLARFARQAGLHGMREHVVAAWAKLTKKGGSWCCKDGVIDLMAASGLLTQPILL